MAKSATPNHSTKATAIDVSPKGNPDEQMAAAEGQSILSFFKGLAPFFATARQLEEQATATLTAALSLTAPRNAVEDEAIQSFIRKTTADRKAAEAHWSPRSAFFQMHKRLIAAEARATAPLERANTIGNNLHNAYVETERRRAAQEQDRVRREAEDKARLDRDAETARMEAEAERLEESTSSLSEREQAFVESYTGQHSQTRQDGHRSAQRAGFKDPFKAGARLLSLPKIQAAIKDRMSAQTIRTQAAAVKEAPLDVEVQKVEANITGTAGRSTWSAELLDEAALINAIIEGKHGIPRDLLTIALPKLNGYAVSMHELVDRWPGVRSKKTTKVI